jgi:hypothetical protein
MLTCRARQVLGLTLEPTNPPAVPLEPTIATIPTEPVPPAEPSSDVYYPSLFDMSSPTPALQPADYITNFPHPVLPPIAGQPTARSVRALLDLLRINATSVDCTRGGGNHGYLALLAPLP